MKSLFITMAILVVATVFVPAQEKMYIYKSGEIIGKYNTSEIDSIIFYALTASLTTNVVSEITQSSAVCGGVIINDGGESITERGICWNTTGSPIYSDSKTSDGSGTGTFQSVILGLTSGQKYYVKAYAKNSVGIAYGNEQIFTTQSAVPPIFTGTPTVVAGTNSATVNVAQITDGGSAITAKGVVWSSTHTSPDLNNNDGLTNNGAGNAAFSSAINGLMPVTTYYLRAYASNAAGTSFSNMVSFTTTRNVVTDIDGNEYGTLTFGSITWMTENLRTTKFNNSQTISESWDYDNNVSNRIPYGRLYSWNAANDSRNACPAGWRLPSSEEWDQMMVFLRDNGYPSSGQQVKAISAKTGWANSTNEGTPGFQTQNNNGSGFSAVPAGMRTSWGYENMDYITWWWTSDDWTDNPAYGYHKSIKYDLNYMSTYVETKETGLSVRCVKDESAVPTTQKPNVTTEGSTNVSANAATIKGKVLSDGGAAILQRGFYWSESNSNPDQNSNVEIVSGTTGDFSKTLSELKENTTYYFRAYASNSIGTTMGIVNTFKTQGSGSEENTFTDQRDGYIYKTVTIGNQVWMAENLKYLPSVSNPSNKSLTLPYYYVHGYNGSDVNTAKASTNYTIYGVLYNWPAAMASSVSSTDKPSGVQGACPSGWHLPSDAEWTQLVDYLGGISMAGGKLKEIGTTHWQSPNTGATNESGFTALPGGARFYDGAFDGIGWGGNWWSSTEKADFNTIAWFWGMSYYMSDVEKLGSNKELGFSVRCVKD